MLCLLLLTCKGKYFISKETEACRVFKTWPRTSVHKGQSQEANVTCSLLFLFHSQSIQFNCSVMSDSLRPHGLQHARLPCPSPTPRVCSNSCPSSRWCHPTISSSPLLSSSSHAFNLSQHQGLFQWVHSLHQVAKVLDFQLQHRSFQSFQYSGLISFRIDWLDLLAVQGTLKIPLQHHSSKASILQFSAFFMVQLSHLYTTTGKTIVLTRWTFVGKIMSH